MPSSEPGPAVEAAMTRLGSMSDAWVALGIPERITLLEACLASLAASADRLADVSGEPLAGVAETRSARLLLEALRARGQLAPRFVRPAPNGQLVARVRPTSLMEELVASGVTVDVWIAKDQPATQGALYRNDAPELPDTPARAVRVLRGRDVATDALYTLFVDQAVAVLALEWVDAALVPVLEDALRPLVDRGVLAVLLDDSDRAPDAAATLPVLVLPGPWSLSDLRFQVRHVTSIAARSRVPVEVVTARGWLQRETFLENLPLGESLQELTLDLAEHDGVRLREPDPGGPPVARFLDRAVRHVNERRGAVRACCLLVDPATYEEHWTALAEAVTDLHVGRIGINVWPDLDRDHGAFLFDHPEKYVVRGPFGRWSVARWFHGNDTNENVHVTRDAKAARLLARRLVAFETKPSWSRVLGVARTALWG